MVRNVLCLYIRKSFNVYDILVTICEAGGGHSIERHFLF